MSKPKLLKKKLTKRNEPKPEKRDKFSKKESKFKNKSSNQTTGLSSKIQGKQNIKIIIDNSKKPNANKSNNTSQQQGEKPKPQQPIIVSYSAPQLPPPPPPHVPNDSRNYIKDFNDFRNDIMNKLTSYNNYDSQTGDNLRQSHSSVVGTSDSPSVSNTITSGVSPLTASNNYFAPATILPASSISSLSSFPNLTPSVSTSPRTKGSPDLTPSVSSSLSSPFNILDLYPTPMNVSNQGRSLVSASKYTYNPQTKITDFFQQSTNSPITEELTNIARDELVPYQERKRSFQRNKITDYFQKSNSDAPLVDPITNSIEETNNQLVTYEEKKRPFSDLHATFGGEDREPYNNFDNIELLKNPITGYIHKSSDALISSLKKLDKRKDEEGNFIYKDYNIPDIIQERRKQFNKVEKKKKRKDEE